MVHLVITTESSFFFVHQEYDNYAECDIKEVIFNEEEDDELIIGTIFYFIMWSAPVQD